MPKQSSVILVAEPALNDDSMDAADHVRKNPWVACPLLLTVMRLILGPTALVLAVWKPEVSRGWFAVILIAGLLSDYFDGVLARRLGVAHAWLRRFDSATDVVFYLLVFAATCRLAGDTFRQGIVPILLMLVSEAACIGLSLARFKTLPATHCYSAKFYGLCLFVTFLGVLCFHWGSWCLWWLAAVGLLANGEVLLVLSLAQRAPVDVLCVLAWRKDG